MDTTRPHIVRTLVRAALVRASLAMRARCQAQRNVPAGRWSNPQQWVRVWRELLGLLSTTLVNGSRLSTVSTPFTWSPFALVALDPNVTPPTRTRLVPVAEPNL